VEAVRAEGSKRREHRDIRIEYRRGRNLRYSARKRKIAIRAPLVSLAR